MSDQTRQLVARNRRTNSFTSLFPHAFVGSKAFNGTLFITEARSARARATILMSQRFAPHPSCTLQQPAPRRAPFLSGVVPTRELRTESGFEEPLFLHFSFRPSSSSYGIQVFPLYPCHLVTRCVDGREGGPFLQCRAISTASKTRINVCYYGTIAIVGSFLPFFFQVGFGLLDSLEGSIV
jgi:hypothetical protein